jgi:hypothetical protein
MNILVCIVSGCEQVSVYTYNREVAIGVGEMETSERYYRLYFQLLVCTNHSSLNMSYSFEPITELLTI